MKKALANTTRQHGKAYRSGLRYAGSGLMLSLSVLLSGCGVFGSASPKPRTLDDTYGELYSQEEYQKCVAKGAYNSRCLKFILRRTNNPEFWPYPNVPPMKWPEPPAQSVYREGMTPREYFDALCKAEAGEFIYRTVQVDGIYQIRPRRHETDYAMQDRYVVEDPYGTTFGEEAGWIPFAYIAPKHRWTRKLAGYSYFETHPHPDVERTVLSGDGSLHRPSLSGKNYQRYFGLDQIDTKTMKMVWTDQVKSKVGFTWRGIRREQDRRLSIAGGELAVVDLATNEVLGLRRGFILGGQTKEGGVSWHGSRVCPDYTKDEGPGQLLKTSKFHDFGLWFLTKVAIPTGAEYEE